MMKKLIRLVLFIVLCVLLFVGYKVTTFDPSNDNYTLSGKLYEQVSSLEGYTRLEDVSDDFIEMLVIVEDQRFYSHGGFDGLAIAQALVRNIKAGELEAGGSTITQQLAKNLFYTQEQSLKRKVYELWTAIELEKLFSKEEIIEMYINIIYYGSDSHGIKKACSTYFNKMPSEITKKEAAVLVGLLPAPSVYNPIANPEISASRAKLVLELVQEEQNE
jgi:membrane peptidoglycan carboxypeptidase